MGCTAGKLPTGEDIDTGWMYIKCRCSRDHAVYKKCSYTCECGETLFIDNAKQPVDTQKFEIHRIYKGDEYYKRMNIKDKSKKTNRKGNSSKTEDNGRSNIMPRKVTIVSKDDIDKLSDEFSSKCNIQGDMKSATKDSESPTTNVAKKRTIQENRNTEPTFQKRVNTEIKENIVSGNDAPTTVEHLTEHSSSEFQFIATNRSISSETLYNTHIENEIQAEGTNLKEEHDRKIEIKVTENASNELDNKTELPATVECGGKYDGNKSREQLPPSLDEIKQEDHFRENEKCQTEGQHKTNGKLAATDDSSTQSDYANSKTLILNFNDDVKHENQEEEADKERIRFLENEVNTLKEKEKKSTELERKMNEFQDTVEAKSMENTKQKEELEDMRKAKHVIEKTAHEQQLELERKEHSYRESTKELQRLRETKRSLESNVDEVSKKQRRAEEDLQKTQKKLQTHEMYWKEKHTLQQCQGKMHGTKPKPLHNLGNTCFMDAMLQNIAWCPKLGDELKKQLIEMHDVNNTKPREMTYCIFNLARYTHSAESTNELSKSSVPERILQAARRRNDVFNGYRQQDSFEMFNTIVDGLKDEMLSFYKEKESVQGKEEIVRKYGAVRLFYGKFITVYKYSSCDHVESVFQSFTSVTVPIIKRKRDYTETPTSHSDNNYENSSNGKSGKRGKRKKKNKKQGPILNGSDANNAMGCPDNQNNSQIHTKDDPPAKKVKKSQSSSDDEVFHDAREAIVSVDTKSTGTQTDKHNSDLSSIESLTSPRDVNKSAVDSTKDIHSRKTVSPFDTITQSDSHETDIEYGLGHGLMTEETFGEDIMSCRKCKSPSTSGTCYKKTLIFEAPYVLVLHIDRFKEDYHGGLLKRNDLVTYPAELDLTPFCSAAAEKVQKDTGLQYKLFGVVVHSGSINGGHYVAYIKTSGRSKAAWYDEIAGRCFIDPAIRKQEVESFLEGKDLKQSLESDDETSRWFYISDEYINECSQNEALNNQNAYVLMYERL